MYNILSSAYMRLLVLIYLRNIWFILLCHFLSLWTMQTKYTQFQQSDAKNFIPTLVYSRHMGSRWYTSHFHVVIIGIKYLPQYGDQGLYCGIAEISVIVQSQEVTACFSSTSVTYCLPAMCFLWGPKRWMKIITDISIITANINAYNSGGSFLCIYLLLVW